MPATEIAALGTFNISRDGQVSGVFDANIFGVADFSGPDGQSVIQGVPFGGQLQINPDCRGTFDLFFGPDFARRDSLLVVSPREIRGVSLATEELFSYEILRIAGSREHDH